MDFRLPLSIPAALLALVIIGCEPANDIPQVTPPEAQTEFDADTQPDAEATTQLWQQGEQAIATTLKNSQTLLEAINTFIKAPGPSTQLQAQNQWIQTELSYQQFYFFSQFGVTEPKVFAQLARAHFDAAAHPIQPGYLDYVGPYPYSGLVHDISVDITSTNLREQHGMTDAEDVVLGLYAIEFMLFGETGQRPPDDYTPVAKLSLEQRQTGFKTIQETPNNRRRALLSLQAQLLSNDLKNLAQHWQSREPNAMHSLWQTLPASAQRMVALKTFERTLTQLLLQTAVAPPKHEPSDSDAGENAPSEPHKKNTLQASRLALSIQSLSAAYPWLPEQQRALIEAQLLQAQTFAQQLTPSANPAETPDQPSTPLWKNCYQALKAAMDIYLQG